MNDENTGAPEVRPSTSLLDCGLRGAVKSPAWPDVTLRDQFAMAALTGICGSHLLSSEADDDDLAEAAYSLADAMMEARNAH